MWVVVVAAVLAVGGLFVFAPSGAVAPTVVFAQAGALDSTFGSGGIVLTRFGSVAAPGSRVSDLVGLPDGRIVAGGSAVVGSGSRRGSVLALARYRRDGALDRTFGSGGRVVTDLPGGQVDMVGLVRRRDGRLVAAAVTASPTYEGAVSSLAIARYLPSGALDRRFGRGGLVILKPPFTGDFVAIARKSDERLVVVYETLNFPCEDCYTYGTGVAVYQLRADGSLDRSFGNRGVARAAIVGGRATSVVIQPDHRIVVAGYVGQLPDPPEAQAMLVRFLPSGRLDRGFGVGGVARTPSSVGSAGAAAVVAARGGDLVVAGTAFSATLASGFFVARFRADGRPRTSFGTGGVTVVDLPDESESGHALLREPDGRLVVGGDTYSKPDEGLRWALVRLLPDGRLDSGFGDGGRAVLPRVDAREGGINALLGQSDGRIVAGGYVSDGGTAADARFALMRFRSR